MNEGESTEVVEADDLIEQTIKKKDIVKSEQARLQQIFLYRKKLTSNYFIRLSTINKLKFLKLLINKIHSPVTIGIAISNINTLNDKLAPYMKVMPDTNYVYDKLLADNNRCMEQEERLRTLEEDIKWFSELEIEKQHQVFFNLLCVSGPAILRSIYPMLIQRNREMQDRNEIKPTISYISIKEHVFDTSYPENSQDTLKIEQLRKEFLQTMVAYKKRVEAEKQKLAKLMKSPSKETQNNIDKEKKKKNKGKKDNKSGKSSNKSKKEADKIIDMIQLLPVWLSKKIFSYIDDKSLKKLKTVNSYWNNLIQNIIKERKIRKQLDKASKKILEQLDDEFLESRNKEKEVLHKQEKQQKNVLGKRENKYKLRGSILGTLRPNFKSELLMETSLFSPIVKTKFSRQADGKHDDEIISFPRIYNEDALYKLLKCDKFLEQTLQLHDEEDVRNEKLYSLSGTSMVFKVDIDKHAEVQDW